MSAGGGRPTHATVPAGTPARPGFTPGKTYRIEEWVGNGFIIWDDDGDRRHRRDPSYWLLTTEPQPEDDTARKLANHDALLDALRRAERDLVHLLDQDGGNHSEADPTVEIVRAAIASAEGR